MMTVKLAGLGLFAVCSVYAQFSIDSLPPHGPAAKARALERAGRVADAESILRNALSAGNDSAEVHGALGLLLYRMGRFRDAVPELGRAAQLAPESPEYSLKLAAAILADHRYSVALDFLNAVAGRFGTIAEYQYNLGLAYYGTRRYENAIAAFGKAIALDPKMDVAYFFTGNAWAGSGDPDKAVAFYRKAIEINPKSAGYYLALGKVLGLIGPERDPESAKWLRKGLALKPGDAASEFALALACERLNDLPCARPLLEDVVKRYPNELSPRIVLARIYAKMHEPEKARTEREAVKRLQEAQRRSNSERPSFSDSELHPPR